MRDVPLLAELCEFEARVLRPVVRNDRVWDTVSREVVLEFVNHCCRVSGLQPTDIPEVAIVVYCD